MGNEFKTSSWMAKEILRHYENNNSFSKHVNKYYAKEYGRADVRPGTTISIPKPARFAVKSGATADFDDLIEESVDLTIAQWNTSFAPSSLEMSVSVSRDQFSERYLKGMGAALAAKVDGDGLLLAKTKVYNATGVPGTPSDDLLPYATARAYAQNGGMPMGGADQHFCLEPLAEATLIDGLKGLFNPTSDIAKQYADGSMGRAIGAAWSMDQNVVSRTIGVATGSPKVKGAAQDGTSLDTDGWTNDTTAILKAGDIFTIAGVFSVNPITKVSTGKLQQFVVQADANAGSSTGPATLSILPGIADSSEGTLQNVSNVPDDDAVIDVLGTGGVTSMLNVFHHRDAFCLASVPPPVYGGLDKCAVEYDPDTGIAIRITQGMDVTTDKLLVRADVFYGWVASRPEWAARIEG